MTKIVVGKMFLDVAKPLNNDQVHLLRGNISRLFSRYDIVHNHDAETGKCKYRYPRIQFKIIDGVPIIIAVGEESLQIFDKIFRKVYYLQIDREKIAIRKNNIHIIEAPLGISAEVCTYRFLTPWVGLNSKNYLKYKDANSNEKKDILKRCLVGNLLAVSNHVNYRVQEKIEVIHRLQETTIKLKGQRLIGFLGNFWVNFYIPNLLGLGKSSSRGFGCCLNSTIKE